MPIWQKNSGKNEGSSLDFSHFIDTDFFENVQKDLLLPIESIMDKWQNSQSTENRNRHIKNVQN